MTDDQQDCTGKLAFSTKDAAEAEARTLKFRRGLDLKVYKCRDCGLWHLSSQTEE